MMIQRYRCPQRHCSQMVCGGNVEGANPKHRAITSRGETDTWQKCAGSLASASLPNLERIPTLPRTGRRRPRFPSESLLAYDIHRLHHGLSFTITTLYYSSEVLASPNIWRTARINENYLHSSFSCKSQPGRLGPTRNLSYMC